MKKITTLVIAAALLFSLAVTTTAQPTLDPTFSGTGYKLTKVAPARDDIARTVLVQENGRILTGGNSFNSIGYSNIAITRLKPNGAYDNTFGTAGITTITGGFFCDMALTSNGKIVVAGSGVGPTNVNNYIVYRLKKNGTPDTTFGINGSVAINIPNSGMICYDVAVQSDGKIVLGGYQGGSGGYGNMLVVRLKSNGTLDNTFGTGGMYTLYLTKKHSECHQLLIQPDGKIVAGGYIDTLVMTAFYRYDYAAIRLNANGTLDNTFGAGGIVRADKGTTDVVYATVQLSDGRIVLGGISNYYGITQFAALCLTPDGSIDTQFGTDGWKFINFYGGTTFCEAMATEADDDIVIAGVAYNTTSSGTKYSIALSKINSLGVLDNAFGEGGIDTSLSSIDYHTANDVALQSDGKIVIAGYWNVNGGKGSFLTARYANSPGAAKEFTVSNEKQNLLLFPNPVSGNSFNVSYHLSGTSNVMLTVYDLNGRIVFTCDFGAMDPGMLNRRITLPDQISAGLYIVRLDLDYGVIIDKIQLIR
ncbi:MAG: T9SS type A sorting domain-containing protein [Chitinophagales bacterium]